MNYLHPLAMLAVIGLGAAALVEGMALRRARLRRRALPAERHRRLAKLFVLGLLAGYAHGLVALGFLRGEALFTSFHAAIASAAAALALGAGALGLAFERGQALAQRTAHGLLGAGCLLLALGSALAGVALLK